MMMDRPTPPTVTDEEARASLTALFDQLTRTMNMLYVRDQFGMTGKASPLYSKLWTASVELNKELDRLSR